MRVRIPAGIGVRDGNAPDGLAGTLERLLVLVAIEQRVRRVAIAVRPTVDGDGQNVACAGKSSCTEHTVELVADFFLEIRKRHMEKLIPAHSKLRTRIKP